MCCICSSGRLRKRVKMTIRSAVLRRFEAGDVVDVRVDRAVLGSTVKRTVHLKPWCFARIFASCGSVSSERYSSSPLMRTMCFPAPGPSFPSSTTGPSAACKRLGRNRAAKTAWKRMAFMFADS